MLSMQVKVSTRDRRPWKSKTEESMNTLISEHRNIISG